jgi:pimeloyl-ACP methyl ester carboxylesterase
MRRARFQHGGLALSYLDSGGDGQPLIALHAHWMEAVTYTQLAAALAPAWRVVALDQRGHGYSDHARSYAREDYLGDLLAFLDHLGLDAAVVLGNSLGGTNAYQFAARHPDRVRALIIEDIGVVVDADTSFTLAWSGTFPSREALVERVGERFLPYLQNSFRQTPEGWRLVFDPGELRTSQRQLHGDYWADWLASTCPALLIRGRDSRVTTQAQVEEMAARRPNTYLVTLGGGHVVHQDDPTGFAAAVLKFLSGL